MRVNIITNHFNGAGLQKDSELLTKILTERGHRVQKLEHRNKQFKLSWQGDLNIFLEVIQPEMLRAAPLSILVPNSEWWNDSWNRYLGQFFQVWTKTKDCHRIWTRKVGEGRCRYIGWEAIDRLDPAVERQPKFLHLAGKSETKNTAAVMDAWRNYRLPYPLTVSAFKPNIVALTRNVPNVTHVERFDESDISRVMNEHQFHIMPSKYEGFGMAIHEALGCGNIVITTDAPPMNEFSGVPKSLLIPFENRIPMRAAAAYLVSAGAVARQVARAASLHKDELETFSVQARAGFLRDREHFRRTLPQVLEALKL